MPPSVGITGGRGILGRRIVATLEQAEVRWSGFAGDVRDRGEVHAWIQQGGFDTVVHAAALVPVGKVSSDPGAAISVNVAGTANVAASCAATSTRLVYLSTAHVYAPSAEVLDESASLGPVSLYGLTKLQGEQWCQRLLDDQLILRLFSFFDPRQSDDFVVPSLCRRIMSAEPNSALEVRGHTDTRDIASAKWLANVITRLALSEATGIVNCGTGIGSRIADVAETLKKALGRDDIRITAAGGAAPTALVANTARLQQLVLDQQDFDLEASLTDYAHEQRG